jgi:hypothetical protein
MTIFISRMARTIVMPGVGMSEELVPKSIRDEIIWLSYAA